MSILHAEIERCERAIVTVDIAQHCLHYADERAKFKGTDEDFVRESLKIIGVYDLLAAITNNSPLDDGITVEGEGLLDDITVLGTVPA